MLKASTYRGPKWARDRTADKLFEAGIEVTGDIHHAFCPWRIFEIMGVASNNGSTMYCKKPECRMVHALATAEVVAAKITGADVADCAKGFWRLPV